jgi:hypothetical protein
LPGFRWARLRESLPECSNEALEPNDPLATLGA